MRTSTAAYVVLTLLLCVPASVVAQDDSAPFSKIERSVSDKEPEWKLERKFLNGDRVTFLWKHEAEEISASITSLASPEEAAKHFQRSVAAVPIPSPRGPEGTIPGLGDESRLWARYTQSGRSAIHFIKGSVHVQISAPSTGIVKRFARLIADEIPDARQASGAGAQ